MNRAYDVEEARPFWKRTLLAIGLTIFSGVFFIVAFVLAIGGEFIAGALAGALGLGPLALGIATVVRFGIIIAAVMVALALLYWAAPALPKRLPFKWVTPGSLLFMGLWLTASLGFGWYVSNFASYNATYGALGGVVILMVFFYITAYLLLVGAELNAILHRRMEPETAPVASTDAAINEPEAPQGAAREGTPTASRNEGMRTQPRRGGTLVAAVLGAATLWHALRRERTDAQRDWSGQH